MQKIQIVSNSDDWEGLYINGVLATQDHHITAEHLAASLGIELEKIYVDYEYLGGEVSFLPEKFNKIPKKYFVN